MAVKKPSLPFSRRLRYALETAAVYALYGFFKILPLETASDTGGFIFSLAGPKMGISRRARKNLQESFPGKSRQEIEKIVIGMWENLGRTVAEYPHLHDIWPRIEIVGKEHLEAALAAGGPSLFFAGHLANWEILAIGPKRAGIDMNLVYRRPNNPWVDNLLRYARSSGSVGHIMKGAEGARRIFSVLKKGGTVGILADQKLNEGIPVPFFGRDAMTAPAIAIFALKFGCPLYPSRSERLGGATFRLTFYPPLKTESTGDKEADILRIMTDINRMLESWIRERPEQWLWLHNRWPDEKRK